MERSVKFHTLGCKTNQYETQAIREDLISSDYFTEAGPDKKADVYIINTCTVTAKADRDCRRLIRHSHRENPDADIIVTGCLAEIDGDMIKALPGVTHIIRNDKKHMIRMMLKTKDSAFAVRLADDSLKSHFTPLKINDFQGRTKAFIKIQDGCDNLCSYCKIPLVRGRSRSRDLNNILEEAGRLLDKGFKELVLTGICLGDWGKDLEKDMNLSMLLRMIGKINKRFRIRLSSIEPNMVDDSLIKTVKESKKVCPHLHIPLQSGSDRILRLMNRPYTAKEYMKLIDRIKKTIPGISITSDVMVGFPTEAITDFRKTVSLIRSIMPSRLHIFTYSKRKGTLANKIIDDLNPFEIKKRRAMLKKIADNASYNYRKALLNKRVEGLVETKKDPFTNHLTGYTDTYVKFLLDGPDYLMSKLVDMSVEKVDQKSTFCKYL